MRQAISYGEPRWYKSEAAALHRGRGGCGSEQRHVSGSRSGDRGRRRQVPPAQARVRGRRCSPRRPARALAATAEELRPAGAARGAAGGPLLDTGFPRADAENDFLRARRRFRRSSRALNTTAIPPRPICSSRLYPATRRPGEKPPVICSGKSPSLTLPPALARSPRSTGQPPCMAPAKMQGNAKTPLSMSPDNYSGWAHTGPHRAQPDRMDETGDMAMIHASGQIPWRRRSRNTQV